ncbi:MAG: MFS transporter [Gemmatimonadota bacterium]|nr:MAG: MFS transporter [Gemmatimonadota bacterium]
MKRISVLMATAFVDMIGFAMIFPLLPFYALRLEAPEWMIGWMIAVFSIAQLASAPLWGRISDRYGRRPAIILGLVGGAVSYTVFGLATSIWMLFLSRLIQGIGGGTTAVLQAYVGDASEPRDRAKALGWLTSATSAGVMVGPAIGSLAYSLGPAAPGLIAAALCLINVSFALRWLPEPKRQDTAGAVDHSQEPPRPIRAAIWEVLSAPHHQVSRLIWIYAISMLGFMSTTAVMALYLESDFGVTAQTIGVFFVLVGGLGVVMRALVLGRLVDRFGETRVMRLGATSLALGIFLIPRATTVLGFGLVVCLVPVGTALLFPSVSALVTHRVRKKELGQALGVQQAFGGMARVIGPIWSTAAFQGLGVQVPFYIASAVVAFVVLLASRIPTQVPAAEEAEAL